MAFDLSLETQQEFVLENDMENCFEEMDFFEHGVLSAVVCLDSIVFLTHIIDCEDEHS
jgi:hypothetical protein